MGFVVFFSSLSYSVRNREALYLIRVVNLVVDRHLIMSSEEVTHFSIDYAEGLLKK